MSKNTKENTGEIPKNTITEQNTNIGLDINETKKVVKNIVQMEIKRETMKLLILVTNHLIKQLICHERQMWMKII